MLSITFTPRDSWHAYMLNISETKFRSNIICGILKAERKFWHIQNTHFIHQSLQLKAMSHELQPPNAENHLCLANFRFQKFHT